MAELREGVQPSLAHSQTEAAGREALEVLSHPAEGLRSRGEDGATAAAAVAAATKKQGDFKQQADLWRPGQTQNQTGAYNFGRKWTEQARKLLGFPNSTESSQRGPKACLLQGLRPSGKHP